MRRQDVIINVLIVLFSAAMIWWIIPAWTAEPTEFGLAGGTLPKLCCSVMGVLGIFQIVTGVMKGKILPDNGNGITIALLKHAFMWFIPMFAIVPLWYYAGFLGGSIPVLFLLLLLAGNRNWIMMALVSIGLPLAIMLMLRYGLQVPTP